MPIISLDQYRGCFVGHCAIDTGDPYDLVDGDLSGMDWEEFLTAYWDHPEPPRNVRLIPRPAGGARRNAEGAIGLLCLCPRRPTPWPLTRSMPTSPRTVGYAR